jgi:hypothetical protein
MADRTRYTANLVSDSNLYVDIDTDRVGIGTTNPTSKLSVTGDVSVTGVVTATAFVGDGSGLTNLLTGGGGESYWGQTSAGIHTLSNVGVGTTNPTSKLSVTGDVSVTGVVTATNFSGSGTNLTGIVTSIVAGSGISLDQSTGEVTISSSASTTEYKILDNIASSFNGSTTQFTISSSAVNFINSEITSAARLLISVGGVVQQPDPTQTNGFYISGGTDLSTDPIKINFVEAPKAGQSFFGVAHGLTISPTTSFVTAEESISYSIVFGV